MRIGGGRGRDRDWMISRDWGWRMSIGSRRVK